MRTLFALLLVLLCCGFPGCGPVREDAPVADAPPECYQRWVKSLDPLDTGVRWECNAESPECWDELHPQVITPLTEKLGGAARSQDACIRFIESLEKRGVIRRKP